MPTRSIGSTTVSLAELLSGSRPPLAGTTTMKLSDYALEIERSGFPAIRVLDRPLRERQIGSYLDRIVEHDLDELGSGVRDRASLAGGLLRRLAASPKHHLTDPALAMSSLGIEAEALLDGIATPHVTHRDGTLLGSLFESLMTLSVRVYAQASRARVSHLRTRGGEHEVDLIVERRDSRVVALEVKLTATVDDDDVRHLRWLSDRLGDNLLDAAVISTGPEAYRRQDGIGVIPAALLTA